MFFRRLQSACKDACRRAADAARRLPIGLLAVILVPSSLREPSVRLVFLGDVMLGRGIAEAHTAGDWETALSSLSAVTRAADLALANLESPFFCEAPNAADPSSLAAPPAAAAALAAAGIDVLTTVNNHALDAGDEGRRCTEAILSGVGMLDLSMPSAPVDFRIRGIGIRLLAFDLTGEVSADAVDGLIESAARAPRGSIVIVSLHWGMEYQSGYDSGQRALAERLAFAGADILWGHHPHVVQPAEWLDGTLVLYSLGNALFDQRDPPSARRGNLVWVEADRRGVRFYAACAFAVDPGRGRSGAFDPLSFRFSTAPPGN